MAWAAATGGASMWVDGDNGGAGTWLEEGEESV